VEQTAAAHGRRMRREEWRLVIRAHVATTREQAIEEVRAGREYERQHYFRRIAGLRSDTTLEQEIAEDTVLVGTPDDVIAALERLRDATGGFGGFLVLAHDWASWEATLRSYELFARYVVPHFTGVLDPVRASYEMCVSKKREYGPPALAAIAKAYTDAGQEMPADLDASNIR
jgi:limonene 1,2-monooxygenase